VSYLMVMCGGINQLHRMSNGAMTYGYFLRASNSH
jgi:hypothetical protein